MQVNEKTEVKNIKKNCNPCFIIMKRELSSYFNSPVAYIVTALFLILTGSFFMSVFYLNRNASLRNLFTLFPMILPAFVPALTMRLYAEEKKSGSLETLLTLPVSDFQVAMGKFLFAFIASAIMIAPTLIYLVGIVPFGKPDIGPVIGGYAASLLLCALFSSIGLFASSITRNQIVSFFVGAGICYVLSLIDVFMFFMPSGFVKFCQYISANAHFTSVSQGVIDTRDLIYFISMTCVFFCLTVITQKKSRE